MVTIMQRFQKMRSGRAKREDLAIQKTSEKRSSKVETSPIDIAPNAPIVAYFFSSPGATEIAKLHLDSPALRTIKLAGIKLVIPLITPGTLVQLHNLGPPISQPAYLTYDPP